MHYEILFDKPAQKFILKQQPSQRKRLLSAISKLPNEGDRKAMKGHQGYFRLRVGDYRVIYTVENEKLIVRVVNIGNRGDVYKK
ncbi:MAG: type II toxin-antitoxin system RelE/ParE family toxin [Clostridium sp.]|nr:type II toxin-antitoxin system RelE/ParE family toxin [Clostridium sp.]